MHPDKAIRKADKLQQRRHPSLYFCDRRGSILILSAVMIVAFVALCAFALDIGYLLVAKTQMQQAADAAALAACAELVDGEALTGNASLSDEISSARTTAAQYAALNKVCNTAPIVNPNTLNNPSGDVVIGKLSYPFLNAESMDLLQPNSYNAVQVNVLRTTASNGEVGLFFAKLFGLDSRPLQATATAALVTSFGGFRAPADQSNLELLPFALDINTWNNLLSGGVTTDSWRWDAENKRVIAGADGIREVNLYPQGTGSPGNRGTVDIGSCNNSTADIARQIVEGISPEDLDHFPNDELKFDCHGELDLNGDTGISAGVKDELASIIGKPRIIPIFNSVIGPGNNATYTIVAFSGIRIMEVQLTGKQTSKRVMIQPAMINVKGGIPSTDPESSYFTYTKPWLVR
jgi:Flp pilus assembly protein TadG